jgi:nicotinate-nucleotide--dimethylbenzimidazole phosphoribosyltransferase
VTVDLAAFREQISRPDESLLDAATARQLTLTKPPGSLGRLEELGAWLCSVQGQCPPRPLERARVVVIAGDHGVVRRGVSAFPPEVTAQMVRNFLAGGAAVNALAQVVGASVRVVDLAVDDDLAGAPDSVTRWKVRRGSGDITEVPALTAEETDRAFRAGMAVADEEIDTGVDVLITGDMGIGNTTAAAALVGLLTGNDAGQVTGRGTGVDDNAWMRKAAAVRDAMRRSRPHLDDPLALLQWCGGADFAAMTGLLLQAAARRTPVVLDGVVSGAAALVAHRVAFRSALWWQAGHVSVEPAHALALHKLGLTPLLDYRLRLGEGTGALVALPLLRAAQALLADVATFAEAGVAEQLDAAVANETAEDRDDEAEPADGADTDAHRDHGTGADDNSTERGDDDGDDRARATEPQDDGVTGDDADRPQ